MSPRRKQVKPAATDPAAATTAAAQDEVPSTVATETAPIEAEGAADVAVIEEVPEEAPEAPAEGPAEAPRRRRGRPPGSTGTPARARPARDPLTIEQIVAVESPRDFRLHPRDRIVAYTAEAAGARQLFTLSLRGGFPIQTTASEKGVNDPQWSPDGRRLAFVREDAMWVVEADGSRQTQLSAHPAGTSVPRWSPDGRRLGFISRRRGWGQVWVVDAPVPRRGRPSAHPRPPEARPVTRAGIDVESFEWSPDGSRIAILGQFGEDPTASQIVLVDVASGREELVAGEHSWDTAARWMPDGSLLYATDADGWYQVVRRFLDGQLATLTSGQREHAEPSGSVGWVPLPAPDGSRITYPEFRDGYVDILVAVLGNGTPKRGRGRPPKVPRPTAGADPGQRINPWEGVWRTVGWLADGAWVAAVGESESRPQDLWLLPVPGVAPEGSRPRQITDSMPEVVAAAFAPGRATPGERIAFTARDGTRIEGTLWRPTRATGRRGGDRVPTILYPHGGPTAQALRSWAPFKQLLVREGFAFLDVDFRGSTGYGREFRLANRGEWGHADAQDMIDAGRWVQQQPWSNGQLAIYGGSYGGYLVLSALVEDPTLWRAGVDLYGDSDIAESYRHGDRIGRLDLHRMMGSPDATEAEALYRRGSPVYRAERIEAPLLILHGRKDKRVVPLMTERMVEALEIEGKYHEVHWYEDEGHGWERRETKRDAFGRILAFLKRHLIEEPSQA